MHELSLHDNKKIQLFISFNTKADTQCKMKDFPFAWSLHRNIKQQFLIWRMYVLKYTLKLGFYQAMLKEEFFIHCFVIDFVYLSLLIFNQTIQI